MFTKSKMTDARREVFYAELHALLTAGLDFSHAFALLIEGEREVRMKALLERLYGAVVGGAALWQAMERSGVFRALDCGVVRIGEQTGRLPDTLDFLRDYYRKRAAQRRMVSSAVSYPLVILCTAVAVVGFMLAVIVPMFEQVYARMGGQLPALTRWIIGLSKSFPAYAAVTALIGVSAYVALYLNRNRKEVRAWTAGLLLRLPVAGAIVRKDQQARFCKLLYLLISSGVPLLVGVEMLAGVIGFYSYRQSFGVICRGLEQGDSQAYGLDPRGRRDQPPAGDAPPSGRSAHRRTRIPDQAHGGAARTCPDLSGRPSGRRNPHLDVYAHVPSGRDHGLKCRESVNRGEA